MGEGEGKILMYTIEEYQSVKRYTRTLKCAHDGINEMLADPDYMILAENTLHTTALRLLFLMAKEIGYMESLETEIANHIKNE